MIFKTKHIILLTIISILTNSCSLYCAFENASFCDRIYEKERKKNETEWSKEYEKRRQENINIEK